MDYKRARTYLQQYGQSHILDYYDELTEGEQSQLLKDIENTNFNIIKNLDGKSSEKRGELAPIESAVSVDEAHRRKIHFEAVGLNALSEGKVAAVLLAGGQGSRLGFNGPKGTFNIGVTRELTIFEQLINNALKVTDITGVHFPIFIMTSTVNHKDTVKFFEEHNNFGYPHDRIHFFVQDVAPTCDYNGKVFLDQKHRISLAPNGNGGWYSSLVNSGLSQILEREDIEWLNVFGVDNVLQKICDPSFIGATILKRCNCGAKVVKKACAEEKVGVLCLENNKPAIVEYYEMPDELKNKKQKGELVFRYGVTLNYLFNVRDLNLTLSGALPYHLAEKAIAHIENGVRVIPSSPCGYKFETLVVDMVKMMGSCLAFEVEREKEFAPIKNATGTDSIETARALLQQNGVKL